MDTLISQARGETVTPVNGSLIRCVRSLSGACCRWPSLCGGVVRGGPSSTNFSLYALVRRDLCLTRDTDGISRGFCGSLEDSLLSQTNLQATG